MNQPDFVVKCYNKQDLAQMYFPDITVRASVNKLRRWMRRCQPLMDDTFYGFSSENEGFFCAGSKVNHLLFGQAGRFITQNPFYSFNKNYGRQHFRHLP
jgi:hypothetical protein